VFWNYQFLAYSVEMPTSTRRVKNSPNARAAWGISLLSANPDIIQLNIDLPTQTQFDFLAASSTRVVSGDVFAVYCCDDAACANSDNERV